MNLGQLECPLDPGLANDLSLILEEEVVSVSWYEAKADNWVLSVLFKEDQESLVRERISMFFTENNLPLPKMTGSKLTDKDWVTAVYQGFPPLSIGRFYIYGMHIQESPPAGLIPLHIEAATAFGSGQHESTEGCLKALSLLDTQQIFSDPLDMGCGSGILAIAMAELWNVPVVACDNDPEAVRVTIENGQKNGVGHLIQGGVSEGFAAISAKKFDIITANILAGPLCHMAQDVGRALIPGGCIILSGLLSRQAEEVIHAYESVGIKLFSQIPIGDWSTLIMRKESNG
ncbi:MAG: 50S ribosomal protein L11 methyltransferase [Alphaproteobacteria bacterium]|nr:50S ribosomal protein L11 methyltransferase [Alphaproteobacteria bacterium]